MTALRQDGQLPQRYLTKNEAVARRLAAGRRSVPLPPPARRSAATASAIAKAGCRGRAGAQWYEADLDFNCGRRGGKRLVWSSDGLIYVTTDHYQTFREVPR